MNIVDSTVVIDRAISYIEKGWTQRTDARNILGDVVSADSDLAVCWCGEAALDLAIAEKGLPSSIYTAIRTSLKTVGWNRSFARFNDLPGRTKEEVISVLVKAKEYL